MVDRQPRSLVRLAAGLGIAALLGAGCSSSATSSGERPHPLSSPTATGPIIPGSNKPISFETFLQQPDRYGDKSITVKVPARTLFSNPSTFKLGGREVTEVGFDVTAQANPDSAIAVVPAWKKKLIEKIEELRRNRSGKIKLEGTVRDTALAGYPVAVFQAARVSS